MSAGGHPCSGPAAAHAATRDIAVSAELFPDPPPRYMVHKPNNANAGRWPRQRNDPDAERQPLLSSSPPKSDALIRMVLLSAILVIWPLAYFAYGLVFVPSQVALYKNLYDDTRAQVDHLLKEKATLVSEVDDLRGQLSNAKVKSFWEIAGTMDTNMYIFACPFELRLQFSSGTSGLGRTIRVADPSSGLTGSRTANTTTLRSALPKSLSRCRELSLSLLMNDV